MSELTPGRPAPAFDLPANGDGRVLLAAHAGRPVVVYFYPKDDTSGCISEAKSFTVRKTEFDALDTVVIGISKDSAASHDKFIAKHELAVTLGADVDGATCEAYGVWVEKSMYGRKYMGIERATFLIDRDGTIAQIWRKVKVTGHVDAVLKAAQGL